ncbi:hypothetical protein [uncultured Shewanella sp.]|uniref:hypothetical protein n=1 Tax=uncultured Shewanella sp. TaxID=173975 RepID=UPI002626961A|nr:hypothetical protein [uncultured Shewanella sp.]
MTINSILNPIGMIIPLVIFTNGLAQANANYPPHSGESPVSYEHIAEPNGEYIVTDRRSGVLDRYMFRDSRQFEISVSIPVHRYIGDVSTALVNGVVSETAKIYIPSYDVDSEANPVADCDGDGIIDDSLQAERDDVYFNGEKIGELKGSNELWKFNDAFDVPIDKVNFPSAPGQVAINTIQIAIDVNNIDVPLSGGGVGCKVWATSIDWVGLKFETAKPIYLLPGLSGNPDALENSGYVNNIQSSLGLHSKVLNQS